MKYKVESKPLTTRRIAPHAKYPFAELKVGESFFVPGKKTLNGSISYAQLKWGMKLATRRESNGLRIWRTA